MLVKEGKHRRACFFGVCSLEAMSCTRKVRSSESTSMAFSLSISQGRLFIGDVLILGTMNDQCRSSIGVTQFNGLAKIC